MPNTYTQIYIQVVFATKGRNIKIKSEVRVELEKYIYGIFNNKKQKVLAIYANPDHLHVFFSYKNLQITIPELIKLLKLNLQILLMKRTFALVNFPGKKCTELFLMQKVRKIKL
ncbi:transposase [Chryseobacterium shandongense]|uniref:transposase n=1 Tax=Chryseobacterium shandongense TaxID=1493872 RepID=UPI001E40A5A1|nr:transposase [Chryseobacterium shandongense]